MTSSSEHARLERTGGLRLGGRLTDSRYCAPCGILFHALEGPDGARAHRQAEHPEQARYEREVPEIPLTGAGADLAATIEREREKNIRALGVPVTLLGFPVVPSVELAEHPAASAPLEAGGDVLHPQIMDQVRAHNEEVRARA